MYNYKEFYHKLQVTVKNYFKGIIKLAIVAFIVLAIGLKVIGINLWWLKALGIAVFDMIPILGAGMIMIPWAILKAIFGSVQIGAQIAALYLLLQLIKFIAEPLIIGKNIGLPPLLTVIVTVICVAIFGPVGYIISGIVSIPIKVVFDFDLGNVILGENDYKEL